MGNMPLYKSVMQKLESQIANGDWKPGDRLPTETEMEQIFAVSNITIRHALKELVVKGLVRRVRGGGSYVNPFPGTVTGEDGRNVAGHIIGLLLPNNRSNGDMMDIVCGVSNICIRYGYLLNVTNYRDQRHRRVRSARAAGAEIHRRAVLPDGSAQQL